MPTDIDRLIAKTEERFGRMPMTPAARAAALRRAQRKVGRAGRKLARIVIVTSLIWIAFLAYGLTVGGLGVSAFMLTGLVCLLVAILLVIFPRDTEPRVSTIAEAPIAALPSATDNWLYVQRRKLPALAAPQLDAISSRLAILEPQLATVSPQDTLAADLNRLLGKHLPELVERYTRVPPTLRTQAADDGGPSIERRLVEGLKTIDDELARVSGDLAAGDRDAFLIQGKFLENRYKADGAGE